VTLARPEVYFGNGGECPERVWPCVASPRVQQPGRVQSAIANKVAQAHHKMRAARRALVGRAAVLAQSFVKHAKSFEPKRVVVPTVAAKNPRPAKRRLRFKRHFELPIDRLSPRGKVERAIPCSLSAWWMCKYHGARSGDLHPAPG
jgi:hypothetical protein